MLTLQVWIYALASVFIVSLLSLVGILVIGLKPKKLQKIILYLISFSAGTLFGDALLHLLPETIEENGLTLSISLYILLGITIFLFLEKVIRWQHCHGHILEDDHIHPFAYMNLIGDGFHNFLDGAIIAASYLISIPVGIATTIAVIFHEIPQEIGDFGVLLQGGFTKKKALLLNFLSALLAVVGAVIALTLTNMITGLEQILIPLAIGSFLYIAGSDLIPEIHKHSEKMTQSILQIVAFLLGIGIMLALLLLG